MNNTPPDFNAQANVFAYALNSKIEEALVTVLEQIEGHVPSHEELGRYGCRVVSTDGNMVITWRKKPIIWVVWGESGVTIKTVSTEEINPNHEN